MADVKLTVSAEDLTADILNKVETRFKDLGITAENANKRIKGSSSDATGSLVTMKGAAGELAGALGVGLSIGAAVSFGKAILDDSDALMKMHEQTGISLQGLQRFQIAGDDASVSTEKINNAIFKLQSGLTNGGLDALNKLGIPFEDIKNLSPENQFVAISDAIRGVKDSTEQARLAGEIFGDKMAREIIPVLKRGFDDVKGATVGMSDDTIRAIDEAGDMMGKFWRETKGLAAEGLVGTVHFVQDGINPMTRGLMQAAREARDLRAELDRMVDGIPEAAKAMAAMYKPPTSDSPEVSRAIKEQEEARRKQEEASKRLTELHKQEAEALLKVQRAGYLVFNGFKNEADAIMGPMMLAELQVGKVGDKIGELEKGVDIGTQSLKKLGTVSTAFAPPLIQALHDVERGAYIDLTKVGEHFHIPTKEAGAFAKTLESIPQTIHDALVGGGGISGAVKAIGTDFGRDLGTKVRDGLWNQMATSSDGGNVLTHAFGEKVGNALGNAMPIIGSFVGPLMGKLIGKLMGGPSQEEIAGRKVEADFQQQFGSFDSMMGAVGKAYEATGRSAQMAKDDVQALMDAEKQGAEAAKAAADKIRAAFNDQEQDASDLKDAIKEYGFTFDQLGPAMQRQQLTERGAKLENQWRLLVDAGIAVDDVTIRMSGSMNDYLQTAMRTGQEVPAEMRPMVEEMIRLGKFTDANGNKIEDLSETGLTFSETMTQGFDRVVTTLNKVFERLGLLPSAAAAAAAQIPDNPFSGWVPPDQPQYDVPSYANEAYDLGRPVVARIGDARGDTESVLRGSTVRELVVNARRAGAAASGGASDGRVLAALGEVNKTLMLVKDSIADAMRVNPIAIRHAMRGA